MKSTTNQTNSGGTVTDDYRYKAFGPSLYHTGSASSPYEYIGDLGYRADDLTRTWNVRARDLTAGRFLSADPLGEEGGDSNFYRPVINDPINRQDPSGLDFNAHLYLWYDRVFSNTGFFQDTPVGHLVGDRVVRQGRLTSFSVDWSELRSLADRFWDTEPNDPLFRGAGPVKRWEATQWNWYFLMKGVAHERRDAPPEVEEESRRQWEERLRRNALREAECLNSVKNYLKQLRDFEEELRTDMAPGPRGRMLEDWAGEHQARDPLPLCYRNPAAVTECSNSDVARMGTSEKLKQVLALSLAHLSSDIPEELKNTFASPAFAIALVGAIAVVAAQTNPVSAAVCDAGLLALAGIALLMAPQQLCELSKTLAQFTGLVRQAKTCENLESAAKLWSKIVSQIFAEGVAAGVITAVGAGGRTARGTFRARGAPRVDAPRGLLHENPSGLVKSRVGELTAAIPDGAKGRITMGVAVVEDANGVRSVLISTSEPRGYLRPGVTLQPGETMVAGLGHAEADIVAYAKANNLKIIDIGATRRVCVPCQDAIGPTGANISTPLRKRPQ